MSRESRDYIEDALDHLSALESHLQRGDLDDPLVFDAVYMRLSAAIESLSHLQEDYRQSLFGDDWNAMWSTRNRIAHAYVDLDAGITAATIEHDIPRLTAVLLAALDESRPSQEGPS